MVPIEQRRSLNVCQKSFKSTDQGDLKCHVCGKRTSILYCDLCHINVCKGCVEIHLFNKTLKRNPAKIKRRWSSEYSKYDLRKFVDGLQDGIRCHTCSQHDPTMHCDICNISFCNHCFGKHLSDKNNTHQNVLKKHRWSDITYQVNLDNDNKNVSNCQMCDRSNPPWCCNLCNINLCRICAGLHLSDQFIIHEVVPMKERSIPEGSKLSSKTTDSVHILIDALKCHICSEHDPLLYCNFCHINLCKACARTHLFDKQGKHKLLPIVKRWSLELPNPSSKLCSPINKMQLGFKLSCLMCLTLQQEVIYCDNCYFIHVHRREAVLSCI